MSLPRYPEYKDSGVAWLGEVPAHWGVQRLKHSIESCRNGIWGGEAQEDEDDILCVRVADFDRQKLSVALKSPTIRSVSEKERVGRVLRQGNLLLEKSGGGENQPVGCVVLFDLGMPAVCSNFVAKMELTEGMVPSFWRYVHTSAYSIRLTVGSINQTSGIQNLDQDRYFNEQAPFPSFDEQTAIATFLDRETAKIDALVAEQEKLLALLAEKRQATISHSVTKGLNRDALMKDSGVEWLGEVPAHWSCQKLSFLTESIGDGLHGTPNYVDESEYFFINGNNLVQGSIVVTENTRNVSQEECFSQSIELNQNSVLLSINGTIGNFALYNGEKVMLGKSAAYINCSERIDRRYLAYFLSSDNCKTYFFNSLTGTTIHNLSLETIRATKVPFPPLDEQGHIIDCLHKETARLDALTTEATRAIALLKERRSALISAAVTGKIDVREPA